MMPEQDLASERVRSQFPKLVLATHRYRKNDTVIISRDGLQQVCQFLRDEPSLAFDFLMDLSCVDYLTFGQAASTAPTMGTPSPLPYFMRPKADGERWERPGEATDRFEVVYHFYSLTHNHRLRLKVPVPEADPVVASLTTLWPVANWFEREVWDMFGVRFTGHPNLTRILMYEPFEGYPLRKDYPVDKRQPLIGPMN